MDADDPRHGTDNGYNNLRCSCDRCRAAHAQVCARYKRLRIARGCPEKLHGTAGGYGNYGCRCTPCTDAWARDILDRYHRRKAL